MSQGICITSESELEIEGYFQNFAMDFENLNQLLIRDGLDLSSFLYCPESEMDEETLRDLEYEEDAIAYMKTITTDDYHPLASVLVELKKALEFAKGYNDGQFDYGKEGLIADLEEMIAAITPHATSGASIQLLRA